MKKIIEKRKACPLLVQSDTNPSMTVNGQSWTRTYFLECLGDRCAAYHPQDGFCERWQCSVNLKKDVDNDDD